MKNQKEGNNFYWN